MSDKLSNQRSNVLLFTADKELEAPVLIQAVAWARSLGAGLTVHATIPMDTLDQDVVDDLLPLVMLKPLVERRRAQRLEMLALPFQQDLPEGVQVVVTTGIEFVELLRARVLGDYCKVLWVRNGELRELDADEDLFGDNYEHELRVEPDSPAVC